VAKWRKKKDPLYRGDGPDGVSAPVPDADTSVVRHILYLDGFGRETPYRSCSEQRETALQFGGKWVWKTFVKTAEDQAVAHISRIELLSWLKGKGKGRAKWSSAFEVLQAKRYVEEQTEHLLDFSPLKNSSIDLADVIDKIFSRG
jgi:hypothetical protein